MKEGDYMLKDAITSDRLTQLKELRNVIAETIDKRPGARDLAQLSRQYRDTLKDIEELENRNIEDEISKILDECE